MFSQEVVEFPIPGKIISVNVKEGDEVKEGDTLCIIESMKMENSILAPVEGTITKLEFSVGQTVDVGGLVAIIEY